MVDAGYRVTVICPIGKNQDREAEEIDRRRAHPPLPAAGGDGWATGIPARVLASPCGTPLRLALRVRRAGHVDVVHACNPPDLLFLVAPRAPDPWRALRVRPARPRARSCSGRGSPGVDGLLYWLTRVLERLTYRRRRRRDLDERELSARRHRAGRKAPDRVVGRPQRSRPGPVRAATARSRVAPGKDVTSPPTSG